MKYKNYTLGFIEIRNIFDECHENKKAIKTVENGIYNNAELLHLAITELDSKPLSFIKQDIIFFEKELAKLDAVRLFSGDFDKNNAYVEIKAGSGGVESQDWANMLVRMYSRWAVTHDFKTETVNLNIGELLGVKSATLHIKGDYAFGWMRTEKGIHRLVRKSPFDSSKRRHTSFTSVFVYPEITRKVHNIKINTNELRIDTYRSSGAGGQHVNTTDSAVRITHLPTKIVVECQSERSQHSNKERALTLLKTKLYDFDKKKGEVERINIEKKKAGICWGNQIRSYVLDAQRIKDLRTGVKNNNCEKVLNGELDLFIEASIKQGL